MRGSLAATKAPILLVPYMWIGDFVRCHTVIQLLNQRHPQAAIDVLSTAMVSPLVDYMPGVRKAVVADLPRRQLALGGQRALAQRLRVEGYGQVLIMPRTWKAALAPFLAGIPRRTGFIGEFRFGLVNDLRRGERRLERMVDRCAALALNRGEIPPGRWPAPALSVPAQEVVGWRQRNGFPPDGRPTVALAPGAVGPAKRWPAAAYAELARRLTADGARVWIVGGPDERILAAEITAATDADAHDLTGTDLRNAILALAASDVAVSNDSGLLHVAAAIGTPAIGIFGPTSPALWAPLNPLAEVVEAKIAPPCRPCHKPTCRPGHHLCMRDILVDHLLKATQTALAAARASRSG